MASFQDATTEKSTFAASSSFDTRISSREATREGGMGLPTEIGIAGLGYLDLVGMNAPKAREAADNMVGELNKTMKMIEGLTVDQSVLDGAIKSDEVQKALKDYIDKEKRLLSAIVSDLKGLCDKLYEISKAWEKSTDSFGQNTISGAATSNFSDVTTGYTTQFTSTK